MAEAMALKRSLEFDLPHTKRVRMSSRIHGGEADAASDELKKRAPLLELLDHNKRVRLNSTEATGVELKKRAPLLELLDHNKRVRLSSTEATGVELKKRAPPLELLDTHQRKRVKTGKLVHQSKRARASSSLGSPDPSPVPKKLRGLQRHEELEEVFSGTKNSGLQHEARRTHKVIDMDSEDKELCTEFANMTFRSGTEAAASSSSCPFLAQVECLDFEYNKVVRNYNSDTGAGRNHALFQLHPTLSYVLFTSGEEDAVFEVCDLRTKGSEQMLSRGRAALEPQLVFRPYDWKAKLCDMSSLQQKSTTLDKQKLYNIN